MNIYVLPTDRPSRLHLWTDDLGSRLALCELDYSHTRSTQHIYITTDEVPKLDEWGINIKNNVIYRDNGFTQTDYEESYCKKIIATTNLELIENGVQNISDEFLEWFCSKNGEVDFVEVIQEFSPKNMVYGIDTSPYKIIIPKEELKHKQETIEEAVNREYPHVLYENDWNALQNRKKQEFIKGAKWQAERMYSEKEVIQIVEDWSNYEWSCKRNKLTFEEWLKQQ